MSQLKNNKISYSTSVVTDSTCLTMSLEIEAICS